MSSIARREIPDTVRLPKSMDPVLRRIYAARGVVSEQELDYSLERLLPFHKLRGIDEACELLLRGMSRQQRVMIVADFDADGATSCALAIRGLRSLGLTDVRYVVPDRFRFGYGLTPEIVAVAAEQEPDILLTVDNGISSIEGVAEAKRRGMAVLITDHHLPGRELPDADAIVNPNQPDDEFPCKNLAGVGVMFYLLMALRVTLRNSGWFGERGLEEPNLARFLDLVAVGTVADVVSLDVNNRILVYQGLARIRVGHCQPGIAAIAKVAGRDILRLSANDLGFAIGPRLNAAGRLEDMSLGIEALISDEEDVALQLARRLDGLNRQRREIESGMQEQALAHLDQLALKDDSELPFGLCLFDPAWHPGVVGIVASRIKDRFHRPVIAFAPADGNEARGSARSIEGLHIRDALERIATASPGLITRFGGHAMAAGLSLSRDKLDSFEREFDAEVARCLSREDLKGVVASDGELMADYLDMQFAETLRNAGPWGKGFPEPVFDGTFELMQRRIVGEKHLKMVLRSADRREVIEAIAFNTTDDGWPRDLHKVRIAYQLDVNEYQGTRRLQLLIKLVNPVAAD